MKPSLRLAMLASLFAHVAFVSTLELGLARSFVVAPPRPEPALEFEFIESPGEEQTPLKPTDLISDKNQRASDKEEGEGRVDEPSQEPYEDEDWRSLPELPGSGGGKEDLPANPVTPPGQAGEAGQIFQEEPEVKSEAVSLARVAMSTQMPEQFSTPEVIALPQQEAGPQGEMAQRAVSRREAGARALGERSFDAREHDLGPYIRELKKRIWQEWYPLVEFKYNRLAASSKTVVSFKVHPDGHISDLKALEHRGDEYLKILGLAAISQAAPFAALPEGFETVDGEETLDILFTFYYY
ncbi:MAG: hypothetical protein HYY14_01115 [Candidatus Omnitrophica bacterium]|nr:hypothetical protein [Candidatus Omnitrophota bacterium]